MEHIKYFLTGLWELTVIFGIIGIYFGVPIAIAHFGFGLEPAGFAIIFIPQLIITLLLSAIYGLGKDAYEERAKDDL